MKIELENLMCGYPDKDVLGPLNLTFSTNEFYCILGSNGIGKTTLFKTLLGFIPAKRGNICIEGRNMSEIGGRDLAKILSYVPQAKSYSYQFSVLDTVVMGRACHIWRYGVPGESDYAAAGEMLGRLGILHLSDKSYSELSGGEQQIVLIARALVQDASFIIMDEPASNLDFENQKRVLDVLKQLAGQGIGIIMSSHSPDHAFYCGASVVLINRDGSYSFGGSNTLLTEENLKKVYGVGLKILSGSDKQGNVIYTCGLEQGALPHLPSDARIGPKPKNY